MADRFEQKVMMEPPDGKPQEGFDSKAVVCDKCNTKGIPDEQGNCKNCGASLSEKRAMDPNVGGGTDRDKIPAEDFAGKDRSYPIVSPGDVSDAASSIGRAGPENYSADKLRANIIRIANRKGPEFVAKLPKSWTDEGGKHLDLSYVKSLGLTLSDDRLEDLLAVKFIGVDKIFHYPFLWGSPQIPDLEREYFQKNTNFWDSTLQKSPKPLTWDHGQDETMKDSPIIGNTVEWGDDEIGRWAISHLDRAHRYRKAVDKLIAERAVGTSSDSAPQYVQREQHGKSTWLKTWPWFASALTDVPCEPRTVGTVDYYKSIGLKLPSSEASAEQTRAMVEKAHRIFSSFKMYVGDK